MGYTGIVAIIGLLTVVGCRPQSPEERWEKGAEWAVEKVSSELDLTTDQRAMLESIAEEVKEKRPVVESIKEGFAERLADELGKEVFDAGMVNKEFERREAAFSELRSFAVERFAQFHATLTSEQRRDLAERMEKMSRRHN